MEHRNKKSLKYRRRLDDTERPQSFKQRRWTFCQHTDKLRQKSHSRTTIDNARRITVLRNLQYGRAIFMSHPYHCLTIFVFLFSLSHYQQTAW